jgi:hypothetical protein
MTQKFNAISTSELIQEENETRSNLYFFTQLKNQKNIDEKDTEHLLFHESTYNTSVRRKQFWKSKKSAIKQFMQN